MDQPLVHIGLDESGSLTAATPLFTLAAVVTPRPETLRNLVKRAATSSGKHFKRRRRATGEFKWSNASRRLRSEVLTRLSKTDAELFALTVNKEGRRLEDSPENYAILVCELLSLCWDTFPNVALSVDRHFTSPEQIAAVNTFIYRQWPAAGVLSITHVDSQRSPLVQLADFVAGCVYSGRQQQDEAFRLIEGKISAASVEQWPHIKERWGRKTK